MKLKILVTGLVCTSLILSSCNDEMNYKQHTNYDKEHIENHYKNVVGLLNEVYAKLDYDHGNYGGAMLASATDEAEYAWESNEIHDFYNGSWGASNAKYSMWTTCYSAIQVCNLFLEEFLGLTFPDLMMNDDYRQQIFRYQNCEHEARFLRAYFYFNLIRQYGDVPFFTHVINADEVNNLTRTPYQTIVDFIVNECDAIVNKIPADYSSLGSNALGVPETGRANRVTVLALKARTLLYAASPLFNTTNDSELWQKAAQANKAVLDSCAKYGYTLGAYTDIWGSENWSAKETIFARRLLNQNNTLEGYNYPIGVEGGNSGNCPTQDLVDAYQMRETGKFWNEDGSGYIESNPYAGRDPRFEMSIVKNGDTGWPFYNPNPIQTYVGGLNGAPISGATPTGYYLKKLLDESINLRPGETTTTRHSYVTYRVGEFYLNYAEAAFKYLGSADATSSDFPMSARQAVNTVRSRVGVDMPDLEVGLSNDEFWKQYTNERMVELAFEGHRFWDVRRWKEGDTFKSITRMKITRNADGTFSYNREVVSRQWDDKMYFFPIPQSERMKNPNLTQNTGW